MLEIGIFISTAHKHHLFFFYFNIHCHNTSTHPTQQTQTHTMMYILMCLHTNSHTNLCTHCVFPGLTLSPPLPFFPLLVPTERCHHPLSPKACLHPGHFFRWPGKSRPAGGVRSQSQPFTAAPATAC